MKNSKILKKAKKLIKSGEENYICDAIRRVPVISTCIYQRIELRMWVSNLLGRCGTYEDWIRVNHSKLYRKWKREDYKQGRLAWLDWMIEYWEAKEKKSK